MFEWAKAERPRRDVVFGGEENRSAVFTKEMSIEGELVDGISADGRHQQETKWAFWPLLEQSKAVNGTAEDLMVLKGCRYNLVMSRP